jgi:hypothetical protein
MADAAAEEARVVQDIPDTKSLDDPSRCGDWDLRTLLNHLILWTSYSAERRAHGESVAEDLMNKIVGKWVSDNYRRRPMIIPVVVEAQPPACLAGVRFRGRPAGSCRR